MSSILHLIQARATELGGFEVLRILPSAQARMVGPFIFVDHMGPATFAAGQGVDVRAHPHIGLATVTYLFEGEFEHRDSLGTIQRIAPGDVNWMTAGRGIVHSERTPAAVRAAPSRAHGMQTWVALPDGQEDIAPAFAHHAAASLPHIELPGVSIRVIAGHAFARQSPVEVASPTLYCAVDLRADGCLVVPTEHAERAVYMVEGAVRITDTRLERGQMAVLAGGVEVAVQAESAARLMLLGGMPLGQRFIWWNFVASSRDRIENAKQEWGRFGDPAQQSRFGPVPGESEFIPLPQR